jgi:hypothetical protein
MSAHRRFAPILVAIMLSGCAAASATPSVTSTPLAAPAGSAAAESLLPDGAWQVTLSEAELAAAGANPGALPPATYTLTFDGTHSRIALVHEGKTDQCFAQASRTDGGVLLTYLAKLGCGGWADTISWKIQDDGLHIKLVDSTAPREENAPYLEAKPWQPARAEPLPSWPDWYVRCEPGCQGPMTSATFTSAGLVPGLSLRFPDGDWFNTRDDEEEIEFDLGDTALRVWLGPRPVSKDGEPAGDVPETGAELAAVFTATPGMVVSKPVEVTLGDGIPATTFTLGVSDSNVNVDPDCPTGVRSCLNVLWIAQGHVFAIAYGSNEQFWTFNLANGQLVVVSLDAPASVPRDMAVAGVGRILASLRLDRP